MRPYRTPFIGPRAAGLALVIVGVTVFVLLGMLAPAPAAAQTSPDHCGPVAEAGLGGAGITCEPVPASAAGRSPDAPAVTQSVSRARGEDFLLLAVVTIAGGILIELRPRPNLGKRPVS